MSQFVNLIFIFQGSEQLSVESAEDALAVIGTPETDRMLNSPEEVSDLEEEEDNSLNLSSSQSDETAPRNRRTSSVLVPPSIFNDHSLMQYSTMSPVNLYISFNIDSFYVNLGISVVRLLCALII